MQADTLSEHLPQAPAYCFVDQVAEGLKQRGEREQRILFDVSTSTIEKAS